MNKSLILELLLFGILVGILLPIGPCYDNHQNNQHDNQRTWPRDSKPWTKEQMPTWESSGFTLNPSDLTVPDLPEGYTINDQWTHETFKIVYTKDQIPVQTSIQAPDSSVVIF